MYIGYVCMCVGARFVVVVVVCINITQIYRFIVLLTIQMPGSPITNKQTNTQINK